MLSPPGPLTKVTRLVNPQISDVLTLEGGANSFGPAITGDSFDAADDLVSSSSTTIDKQVYYSYEMAGPHIAGEHLLASLTFKGGVSVLCVAAASEKQWAQAEANLRQIVASFRIGIPA
jgi:PsbP